MSGFAKVPNLLLECWARDADLSPDIRVLALLLRNGLRKGEFRGVTLSGRAFQEVGLNPRTGQRALRDLLEAGLVECVDEPRGRRAGRYILRQPLSRNQDGSATTDVAQNATEVVAQEKFCATTVVARTIQEEYFQEDPPKKGGEGLLSLLVQPSEKDRSACRVYERLDAPSELKREALERAVERVKSEAVNGRVGRINALALQRATEAVKAESAAWQSHTEEHYFN